MNSQPPLELEPPPGPPRRRLQYSLLSLLGLVTVTAIYLFTVPGGFEVLAITGSWLLIAALVLGPLLAVQGLIFLLLHKAGLLPRRRH